MLFRSQFFVRTDLNVKIKSVCKGVRLLAIQVNDLLVFFIYMPYDDNEMFSSILGSISDYIVNKDDSVAHYIVLGYFNCSYLISNPLYDVFHCFTTLCNLNNVIQCNVIKNPITYRHNTRVLCCK